MKSATTTKRNGRFKIENELQTLSVGLITITKIPGIK
jgi:hypothetical protein